MLKIINDKGFQLTFDNKLTISVMFGSGNYCSNKNTDFKTNGLWRTTESENAEIAIWDKDDNWFDFECDVVKGWVKTNEIGEWIVKVKNATDLNSIKTPIL
jgi:hypothetical protein